MLHNDLCSDPTCTGNPCSYPFRTFITPPKDMITVQGWPGAAQPLPLGGQHYYSPDLKDAEWINHGPFMPQPLTTPEQMAEIQRQTSEQVHRKWDVRFLRLAELVSSWSKDPSTKCGAVIVRPDKTVASLGFNGFPRGCCDDESFYADRELKYSRVVHAEVNAILHCHESMSGYTMYTWPKGHGPSCDRCATCIIQAGIKRVVHVLQKSDFADRWREAAERGLQMYREAGVEVVHISPETLNEEN